jgi:hypothetical protein
MRINGKPSSVQALPPLPLQPQTPAERLAASDVRQPHHAHLNQWLEKSIHSCRTDLDIDDLGADEVLCAVNMRKFQVAVCVNPLESMTNPHILSTGR